MNLRPYQDESVERVLEDLLDNRSTLIVLPTGCGKTICFSFIAKHFLQTGRVLVLAHREELIYQAKSKISSVTGIIPDIEMGQQWADDRGTNWMVEPSKVVVSTVQTQISGMGGKGRMSRFDPHDFSLVVVDEAHHAAAGSYRKVLDHYLQNHQLRVLGVTATPDRADEEALGKIFDSVAYCYEIYQAINDGWLVPVMQRTVHLESLDFSSVRTTAGDLNGADLAAMMEYEKNLHGIAHPTYELAAGRRTLIFAASVEHAERLAEILNRHQPDCARWISGATDSVVRQQTLKDYKTGQFQFLVNCAVFTEGFDEPGIQLVVMARPTKSRALYAQMAGRGTRPLPDLVDGLATAEARRAAIASSAKPSVELVDFVGNCGRHKLISSADILGGNYEEDIVAAAKKSAEKKAGPVDMRQELENAEAEKRRLEAEKARQLEASRRSRLVGQARYSVSTVDPFDILDVRPAQQRGWDKVHPASQKQVDLLRKMGVKNAAELSKAKATQLIGTLFERRNAGLCSYGQAKILKSRGYDANVSFADASKIITEIAAKEGWKQRAAS